MSDSRYDHHDHSSTSTKTSSLPVILDPTLFPDEFSSWDEFISIPDEHSTFEHQDEYLEASIDTTVVPPTASHASTLLVPALASLSVGSDATTSTHIEHGTLAQGPPTLTPGVVWPSCSGC